MTSAESAGTEEVWTSAKASARRKSLTDAGMERPVAEALVDLLDDQAAPMMTRAEADARFVAMLDRHDAQRAQDRAELKSEIGELRAELKSEIGELRGQMGDLRGELVALRGEVKGEMNGLRGEMLGIRGEMLGIKGEFRSLKWIFGSAVALLVLMMGGLGYLVTL